MKKILLVIISCIVPSITALSQKDKEAVSVLDRFSSTAASAPSVSMTFLLVKTDAALKTSDTLRGSIILSKDSYKLDLPGNTIWFNGKTSWSYLPEEQEVTITEPDKKDDSFQARPSSIFTLYKKGYKIRLIEEKNDSYTIDLYPEEINNELVRVRLGIAKPSLALMGIEYKRRDGVTTTVLVRDYSLKKVTRPGMFIFSPEMYKGAEIIDMR